MLAIRITGDPVLHSVAAEVDTFDDALRTLVADMRETMAAAPGVGLAGPQVGVGKRIFVYDWTDDDGVQHEGVAINPTLLISPPPVGEADEDDDSEGCLSIPGERLPLLRSHTAVLDAFDLDGEPYRVVASGWLARIFQHEFDHLDGILYADRLEHAHRKVVDKAIKRYRWGKPGTSWQPGVDDLEP